MSIRGERFTLDLDDHDDDDQQPVPAQSPLDFVKDIVERDPIPALPPQMPKMRSSTTGFPQHKQRKGISAFKQQRNQNTAPAIPLAAAKPPHSPDSAPLQANASFEEKELRRIGEENRQRLAAMSEQEIAEERRELMSSLDPGLIERLLKRANIDDGRGDTGLEEKAAVGVSHEEQAATPIPQPSGKRLTTSQSVTIEDDEPAEEQTASARTVTFEDDEPSDPGPLQTPANFQLQQEPTPSVHFPGAPSAPELDPSSPTFLENLHTKYFPSLPADPSKLAWMAPIPTHGSLADQDSPYYPAQAGLAASSLRFDFRGALLPPRIARAMPTTKGLHHHGEAPEAAGYTVPELARLARSAFPAQRCVAFQTLGRLLYRLGRGGLGAEGTEIVEGLWECVAQGKVIETLEDAANVDGGHQGCKTYAVEAVWLWQKGGGRKWKAT